MTDPAADRIVGLYDDKAEGWVADRGPALTPFDRRWFDRLAEALPSGATVLDLGCGSGWPVAADLLGRGLRVTGVDASPRLIAHAAETLLGGEWIVGDMRTLDLGRRFDGVVAWFSLFHLTPDDQRIALDRMIAHAADRAVILFPASDHEGVKIGEWRGELLYHASLSADEYRAVLETAGFTVDPSPPSKDGGVVWMGRRDR